MVGPGPGANAAVAAVDMGTVRKAMAFKVKYRVASDSKHVKQRLPLRLLGVHPANRGGVFPQANVVRALGIKLGRRGFSQEEADHQGVCVRQPTDEKSDGKSAVADSFAEYNQKRCQGQPYLEKCFGAVGATSNIAFGMLYLNHILLVLLCWLFAAQWDLDDEEKEAMVRTKRGA